MNHNSFGTSDFQAISPARPRSLFIEEADGGFIVSDHSSAVATKRVASTRFKLAAIVRDWAVPAAASEE